MKFYNELKKNKYYEIISYLFFGGLTTIISVLSFHICTLFISNDIVSNTISWILAVIFAYLTNRKYVFNSNKDFKKELFNFFFFRIITLLIETIILPLFINLVTIKVIAKIITTIIVIILNYVFSKIFIFKK